MLFNAQQSLVHGLLFEGGRIILLGHFGNSNLRSIIVRPTALPVPIQRKRLYTHTSRLASPRERRPIGSFIHESRDLQLPPHFCVRHHSTSRWPRQKIAQRCSLIIFWEPSRKLPRWIGKKDWNSKMAWLISRDKSSGKQFLRQERLQRDKDSRYKSKQNSGRQKT